MKTKQITKTYLYFDSDSKKNFLKWLLDSDLSIGEVCDKLNVSYSYLYLVLNGQREVTDRLKENLKSIGYEM